VREHGVEFIQGLLLAFASMVILMPPFLRLLRWLGMGKQIREDGPGTHLVKQGTPTMGGVLIVFVTLALATVFNAYDVSTYSPLFVLALVGALGAVDDYLNARTGIGIRGRHKILWQLVVAIAVAIYVQNHFGFNGLRVPFLGDRVDRGGHHQLQLHLLQIQADLPLFGPRDGADVLGQAGQTPGLRAQQRGRLGVQRCDAVLQRLKVGIQGRDRCAHLVSEIGEQPTAGCLDGSKPPRHLVEPEGKRVELRPEPWTRDPHVVMPTSDVACSSCDGGHGSADPASHVHADRKSRHQCRQ